MYLSEFCDVKYEEKHNVVLVEWKKFCCREDYRKPLEYALDIIKNHEGCNYVADTRNGFENISEDTEWVTQYFMPKAKEYGCKIIYFIIDKNKMPDGFGRFIVGIKGNAGKRIEDRMLSRDRC